MKTHLVPRGTMPAATVKLAIDPASSYPKELKKKLARQRRARICWNAR